jgi:hypothetical protein
MFKMFFAASTGDVRPATAARTSWMLLPSAAQPMEKFTARFLIYSVRKLSKQIQ